MSGKARIGSTVIGSSRSKSDRRVLQVRLGRPSTSAPHEPHLAALQFQRTARSGASWPWIQWRASSTTIPSSTGTSNSSKWPGVPGVPRKTLRCASGIDRSVVSVRRRGGRRSSSGIFGSFAAVTAIAPSRCGETTLLRLPQCLSSGSGWSRRLWAPRLSVRCRALRVIASETISRARSSKTRFQPGL